MFDSPFVRRVGVSMKLLGIEFEHRNWSVGRDFDLIRQYHPLGMVPALVLESGEVLGESAAILDYMDDHVGPRRALLPSSGEQRRRALQIITFALGAAEKARSLVYERVFRPAEKYHAPWTERCQSQMHAALAELQKRCAEKQGQWLVGEQLGQADISTACAYTFLTEAVPVTNAAERYPALHAHVANCEALPEFQAIRAPWFAPSD
jgi:glutathione S-transferase